PARVLSKGMDCRVKPGNHTSSGSSCAGLTRASIDLRKSLSKGMDCRVKPGNDTSSGSSCAGLTRASIDLRKSLSRRMDCRVKPGNDECFTASGQSHHTNRARWDCL